MACSDLQREGMKHPVFGLFSRPLAAFSEAICKAMRGITLFPTMKPLAEKKVEEETAE